jgi:apolipoprotein N-acyltransferase
VLRYSGGGPGTDSVRHNLNACYVVWLAPHHSLTRVGPLTLLGQLFGVAVSKVTVHCSNTILLEVLQQQLRRVRHVCAEAAAAYACGKAVDQRVIDQSELNVSA